MTNYAYPSSFPNGEQLLFLKAITAPEGRFQQLWTEWTGLTDLDAVDTPTYRLLPSLYLRMAQEEDFQDAWLGRIKGVYRQGWARNQMLLHTTSKVVAALHQNGIPSIMLKGISLLLTSYKDVGGRMMGDADLLVPVDKAVNACNLMLSMGWKCRLGPNIQRFDEKNILLFIRASNEKSFVNAQGQIIDMHFISPLPTVNAPDQVAVFWQTALPITVNGVECRVLSPELLFLHVCHHGYRNNRTPTYRWVLDALRTVQATPAFNWPQLIDLAALMGFTFHIKMAVSYLVEHFELPIPDAQRNILLNYSPSNEELRGYYGAMNLSIVNMGNLPILWKKFKYTSPTGPVLFRPFQFSAYLRDTYNLDHSGELVPLYVKRFINRLKR